MHLWDMTGRISVELPSQTKADPGVAAVQSTGAEQLLSQNG
jgi:hypothetical protein